VGRRVIAGTAAALAVVAIGGVAIASRGSSGRPQQAPPHAKPSQQFGDDADLMRRLERKKLTTTTGR
jgi:hypothetical protein